MQHTVFYRAEIILKLCDLSIYTGRFVMFSVITKKPNKKTKGPTLMELFTATGN